MNTKTLPEPASPASTETLTEQEALNELGKIQDQFTDADFDALESELHLRAAVLGWTGDPLKQPVRSVLASARSVLAKKEDGAFAFADPVESKRAILDSVRRLRRQGQHGEADKIMRELADEGGAL